MERERARLGMPSWLVVTLFTGWPTDGCPMMSEHLRPTNLCPDMSGPQRWCGTVFHFSLRWCVCSQSTPQKDSEF